MGATSCCPQQNFYKIPNTVRYPSISDYVMKPCVAQAAELPDSVVELLL